MLTSTSDDQCNGNWYYDGNKDNDDGLTTMTVILMAPPCFCVLITTRLSPF